MAKTKISEYSTTAGNNTDINSINIAEGCAPSGINDAIRELMRQLKEFQTGGAGDSVNSGGDFSVATNKFTVASASGNTSVAGTLGVTGAATLSSTLAVTGTTTLTGALVANGNATLGDASGDTVTIKGTPTLEVNPTLSGGTANGVLYLNGSKVATSGSALTFDGTYFTVGASATTGDYKAFIQKAGGELLGLNASSGALARIAFGNATASFGSTQIIANGADLAFITNSAEQMRLTGTGLGIGTSSPAAKLQVRTGANQNFVVNTQGGELSIESSNDAYSAGAPIRYYATAHTWFSGANTMRLDSAGNLGLGVTSPTQVIDMVGNIQMRASGVLNLNNSDNSNQFYLQNTGGSGANNANLIFQKTNYGEVARIDSSGNLLVDGTTLTNSPSQGAVLGVGSGIAGLFLGHANGTATGNYYATFSYNGGIIGSITQSGTTAVAYNTSSDYRLKNIDGPLTGSGAFIDALKPKVGTWKADGSRFVGFLAHEVQEVSPNSVVGEKDGEQMQAMEYGSAEFIANIIAELQSLRARVAALES